MNFFGFPAVEKKGLFMAARQQITEEGGVLLGAPLDDTGSFRSGSRFAPEQIRVVSRALEEYSLSSGKDLRNIPFYDIGDLLLTPGNTIGAVEVVSKAVASLLKAGQKPFLMGGEHTVTVPAVRECQKHFGSLVVLYFDAHADLRSSYGEMEFSHACTAFQLQQMQGVTLYQFGIRSADGEELSNAREGCFFPYKVIEPLESILSTLADSYIYITLDMDVVDPAYAPGVSVPEPGGVSAVEILEVISLLERYKKQIVGIDLVEICPAYDSSQITALLGAKIIREALLSFL